MAASEWSHTIELRILERGGKRVLQQRFTRCITHGAPKEGNYNIEERWMDVPTVKADEPKF